MAMASNTKVSLYFACEGLGHLSDVKATLQEFSPSGAKLRDVGSTEYTSGKNIKFCRCVVVEYLFESRQSFRLLISDSDNIPIAHADFSLVSVMTSSGFVKDLPFAHPNLGAVATVTAVDHSITKEDILTLSLAVDMLPPVSCCGEPCTYYVLYRVLPSGQRIVLHKSEVQANNSDPRWSPMLPIRLADMMHRDPSEKTLDLVCLHSGTFSDVDMGHVMLSVVDLQRMCDPAFSSRVALARGQRTFGFLRVVRCDIQRSVTFVDLLALGWQVNMLVAVDFTASNGDPKDRYSLHNCSLPTPNEYLRTIRAVGDIVLEYDTDKMVAGFGFGAELPDKRVSQFFHLTLTEDPYVSGIDGLVEAYKRALTLVRLSGPTLFAPTLRNVLQGVHTAEADHIYTILLMITDGEINDMEETIDALVEADDAALSIIIVGVGDCDFKAMIQLDGDNGVLVHRSGRRSRRDLVQFVPMRDFANRPGNQLAAEVLREVPAQVERWAVLKGIQSTREPSV